MKRTCSIIAIALLLVAPTAAQADTRIAKLCGSDHVNEAAAKDDVRPNPAGFYVASLREQVSLGDPRIVLSPGDDFYLCPQSPTGGDPRHGLDEGSVACEGTHR